MATDGLSPSSLEINPTFKQRIDTAIKEYGVIALVILGITAIVGSYIGLTWHTTDKILERTDIEREMMGTVQNSNAKYDSMSIIMEERELHWKEKYNALEKRVKELENRNDEIEPTEPQ